MPLELKYGSFSVLALVFSVLGFQFLLQLVELVVCDDVGLIKHLLNGHDLTLKEAIITIVSKKKARSNLYRRNSTYSWRFHIMLLYLWNVELQHVLHPVLQGDDGRGTRGARALHLQLHDAVVEAHVHDVAAVFLEEEVDMRDDDLLTRE